MNPKVSIITVNLNNKDGLWATIESVKIQEFRNFQFLIIDGASTDGSVEVIRENPDIIKYCISEKDEGVYDAMNKGILKAQGDYCYFLNSGDTLASSNVLKDVFTKSNLEDIIYGNMIHGGKETIEKSRNNLSFFDFYVGSIYHQSAFIRRNLFFSVGLYNKSLRVVSDWEFFLKAIFLNRCSTKWVDVTIARYEIGGLSFQNADKNMQERMSVLNTYFPKFIEDYNELSEYKQSDLSAIHRLLNKNELVKVPIRIIIKFSRYIRFNLLKMKYS